MFAFSGSYWTYILPAIALSLLAQWWVSSTYRRWSTVGNHLQLNGAEAAQRLLTYGGLHDVRVEAIPGTLTDHYDPRSRTLRLSPPVAQGASIAALAVAAHEIGHAMQDKQDYFPLRLRSALVPAVNIGSTLGWILILIGLMLRQSPAGLARPGGLRRGDRFRPRHAAGRDQRLGPGARAAA